MKKMEQIKSSYFFDMLDFLINQFLKNKNAQCIGKDFGEDIIPGARDYFSIAVINEKLPDGFSFFSVLRDDAVDEKSGTGMTYIIFIDSSITEAVLFQPFLSIILAHQICHFAFFYESYIKYVNNKNKINMYNNFIDNVSNIIPSYNDNIIDSLFDKKYIDSLFDKKYNIIDLIKKFGKYPKEHFTHNKDSNINYEELFNDLINHLNFLIN
jgi:hypothetical protein